MRRKAVRRFFERAAVASLPAALVGCGAPASPGSDAAVALDLSVPDDLLAPADLTQVDLICQPMKSVCLWYVFSADAGALVGNTYQWPNDGGMGGVDGGTDDAGPPLPNDGNPCAPCQFELVTDIKCGYCTVITTGCGVAYACDLDGCSRFCTGVGRRPAGLHLPELPKGDAVGAWLARAAHLEAASVPAFAQLERELAAHRAPERLLAGARRARLDEQKHAQMMAELARAHGARVPRIDLARTPLRPLDEVALENAVEGCVRESQGALTALVQSRTARDPRLARVLAEVATDEARHGRLAWAVDAWARPRLDPAARARMDAARASALTEGVAA